MNFENLGDKIIDDQGNVKTIASGQDARLYYLDFKGRRKKYLLEGEGGSGEGGAVNSVNGQTGDVELYIPTLPDKIVNTINGKTGNVTLDIPTVPNKIVNTINGQTGDVVIEIPTIPEFPTIPEKIVTSFNGLSGDVTYPKYVEVVNDGMIGHLFDFDNDENLYGKITYLKNAIPSLTVNLYLTTEKCKEAYVIVKTNENFSGLTVEFSEEIITNAEFVMEPNKTYLIGCTYPLATIVELENVK